tara:strand:- start:365 stop:508 length:144 start_codon:yes stop_codon:yes gene_type:complete
VGNLLPATAIRNPAPRQLSSQAASEKPETVGKAAKNQDFTSVCQSAS